MIEIVAATRLNANQARNSPIGKSILRLTGTLELEVSLYADNRAGLPEVYNREIRDGADDSILVFVHDDVWIEDAFLEESLVEALDRFDIVGIAGNRRRIPGATTWALALPEKARAYDTGFLSGRLGTGKGPFGKVASWGPTKQSCQFIDGVFMAARRGTLRRASVFFDERFRFHLYDLDFCRTATRAGLTIGTWPISVTHESGGDLDEKWKQARQLYLEKWGD